MSQFRFTGASLLVAVLGLSTVPALMGFVPAARAEAMRAEIAKPLQAAADLMKAKKYKDALVKIREADAVSGKTPAEQLVIERTRASAAQMAGDFDAAAKAFEAVLATGKLTPAEASKVIAALPSLYFQTKNWPQAISALNRQLKENGDDAQTRGYLIQAYFQSGDYSRVQKEVTASIQNAEKAGRPPAEDQLQMLANAALKQKDKAGYVNAIEKLVAFYPSKSSWSDLLARVEGRPGFSQRLSLDVYRLKYATGQIKSAADFMEMAQLALQTGAPHEALKLIDAAYKSGAFGTGAEASRQKRLKDLAEKTAAEVVKNADTTEAEALKNKDGNGLANLGYALVVAGDAKKGLPILEAAAKSSDTKRQEDAKLHLALALIHAGKRQEGIKVLRTVQGTDGTADLARYWILHLKAG